ncbi:MAG: hypothetical protein IPO22_23450 [Anaerolineales bacterium]|nr:hypothetical protein [Anaerolineales bacterium]
MKELKKFGGFAAFYLAAAYIIGLILFVVVLDYPSITDPAQKLTVLVENQLVIFRPTCCCTCSLASFWWYWPWPCTITEIWRTCPDAGSYRGWNHLGGFPDRQRHGF